MVDVCYKNCIICGERLSEDLAQYQDSGFIFNELTYNCHRCGHKNHFKICFYSRVGEDVDYGKRFYGKRDRL